MHRKSILYLLISAVIIVFDQISKNWVISNLAEYESVSIIGDLLYFRFIFNEGGAMGTSVGPSWVYAILTVVALVLIIRYYFISQSDGAISKLSLALILGGAVGNLIDRLRFGKVVDFIDADFPDIPFLNIYRWFTFNIADAAITVGLILFAIGILRKHEPKVESQERLTEAGAPEVESDKPQ